MDDERRGKPLISVLITSYNYLRFIMRAIDSVRAQTYANVEIIVLDNCSTDGTVAAVRERYAGDLRVKVFENETNIGEIGNAARIFDYATGEFVLWLSADDWMYPRHLARLYAPFEDDPALDVVYSGAFFADESGRVYARRLPEMALPFDYVDARDELIDMLVSMCPICWPAALFRRSMLHEVGVDDPDGPHASDWELQIRIALAGKRFAYVAGTSAAIRGHPAQGAHTIDRATGRIPLDFLEILEMYVDHPGMERVRGREAAIAGLLRWLVADALAKSGREVLSDLEHARVGAMIGRLEARAASYDPARVREHTISVILPISRSPLLAQRAIDSVAAQSIPNWQLVVIDHGPTALGYVLDEHPARDRIVYGRSDAPLGPGAARNLGLRMARGEFLAFLEEEDTYAPDHLAALAATIEYTGAAAAAASSTLVLERADEHFLNIAELGHASIFRGPDDPAELRFVADALPLGALLVYRNILDRVGGFGEGLPILDGYEFLLRVEGVQPIAFSPDVTLNVRAPIDFSSALGGNLTRYLSTLDTVWQVHAAPPSFVELRSAQRAAIQRAIADVTGAGGVTVENAAALLAVLAGHATRRGLPFHRA